jgi:uncharacterized protein YwgA
MTRYQLAKLISWAGTLHSRKRMQKVAFMLQAAGFPTEAEYRLHHFGPYSDDVAHLADEMAQIGLLEEEEKATPVGNTYDYRLSEKTVASMAEFEATSEGQAQTAALAKHQSLAKRLIGADLKDLEHAATLIYFQKLRKNSLALRRAESLAREIVP